MTKLQNDYPLKNKYFYHLIYTVILPIYLILFFYAERVVTDNYWVSYLPIDDYIPFLEGFIVFYYLWYPLLGLVGLYLIFRNANGYKRYMTYIGLSFSFTILICLIFPNGQNLRPTEFTNDNIFTHLVSAIYNADTNTNVCPSVHVIGCFAAVFGIYDCEQFKNKKLFKIFILIISFLISISTVFVKQHSILDILIAIPYSLLFWVIIYKLPKKFKSVATN